MLRDVNYFGTMLVYMDKADGLVSGAIHSTGDTVRPALQIIKTKPGVSRTSGAFVMVKGDERYLFADCAININPGVQELAEIAVESANTAKIFDIDPQVAMLSFSTMGSAKSDEVTKVQEAVKLAKELAPNEKDIPSEFVKFKAVETIDKKAIYELLKNGETVRGAELKPNRKTVIK